jgi:RNA polymerase sigma factor (sigma-70 family)
MKNYTNIDDAIRDAIANRRDAQGFIFEKHYGLVMNICSRYANDDHEAKDMLQEGFIKLFSKLPLYQFSGSFEGWLKRMIGNNCIDIIRKRKSKEVRMSDNYQIQDDSQEKLEDQDLTWLNSIKAKEAINAIQALSPQYKMVFNLFVFENLTHKEIAEELGISEGTSKSNLAKSKKKLKELLKEKFELYEQQ